MSGKSPHDRGPNPGDGHRPVKYRLSWVLKALITSGLLFYILTTVPIEGIVPAIASARVEYFAVSILLLLLKNYIASWRMKRLTDLQGMTVSLRRIFEINLITSYYGLFLPGSLAGGAIRWHKLHQIDGNGLGIFIAILYNRYILTIATAAIGVVFWILAGKYQASMAAGIILLGILIGLLILQGVFVHGKLSAWAERTVDSWVRMPESMRDKLRKLFLSLGQYRTLPPSTLIRIVLFSIAEELVGVVSFVFVSLAIGLEVPPVQLAWIRSCIIFVTMLPISFSGFGVREGTLITLLAPYGVGSTAAVAYSLLLYSRNLLLALAGGILETGFHLFPGKRKAMEDPGGRVE